MKKKYKSVLCLAGLLLATGSALADSTNLEAKPASPATVAAQQAVRRALPVDTGRDLEFARRGFIATLENPLIHAADGRQLWDTGRYDWVEGEAPDTVNPALWRHVNILATHGLFEVAEDVWQVRGLDAANMTIVRGDSGWIIIDPLFTVETASAAIALVNKHLGERPVSAVIYTHSHSDHFGGVRALVDEADKPLIIAPEHLIEETVSEFLIAGNVMSRRVTYQFGLPLPADAQSKVSGGIVLDTAPGLVSLIEPSDSIRQTGETRTVDGVRMTFQMVPESEAPSEMNLFLPDHRTLYISEIASCTMHNIQTPRGAKARDALQWAGYLTEAINLYAENTEALATGHCWPRFGNDEITNYLGLQRDNYKFIHDQTVRLMNKGETPAEIAEQLTPPAAIANEWSNRGYYGTLRHNAKAVYQYYIGWWDGNPAHLDAHPPVARGTRYVAAMGGADKVLAEAAKAMNGGDYRWAAELLNHLVFADADNAQARSLLADSYEQLGYQAESAIWRNYYLTGAAELRGTPAYLMSQASPDLVSAMPVASFLDMVATRLDPAIIGDSAMTLAIDARDTQDRALVTLRNGVLINEMGKTLERTDIQLSGNKAQLMALLLQDTPLQQLESAGLAITGDRQALEKLRLAIEAPAADFPVVTP